MKTTRGGFTLIEMLVVITIILILIGLLFPVFQGVFRSAYETQCQNHLNQLGQVTVAYCQAHDGRFPPPGDSAAMGQTGGYTSAWAYGGGTSASSWRVDQGIFFKEKLVGDPAIFWCPMHFDEYDMYAPSGKTGLYWYWTTKNTVHWNKAYVFGSYAMNGSVYYKPSGSAYTKFYSESRLLSDFSSKHFLFIEEHERDGRYTYDNTMFQKDGGSSRDKIADRHQGYGYIACMDGHVIKMTPAEFDLTKTLSQRKYYWTPW